MIDPRLIALFVITGVSFYGGWHVKGAFVDSEKLAEIKAGIALQAAQVVTVNRVERKYVDRVVEIQTAGTEIVRTITQYIQPVADAHCAVPNGFVRVHDASAEGRPTGAPADSDAASAGIALSAVANTIAANYTDCRVYIAQVKGWQEFYQSLRAK